MGFAVPMERTRKGALLKIRSRGEGISAISRVGALGKVKSSPLRILGFRWTNLAQSQLQLQE